MCAYSLCPSVRLWGRDDGLRAPPVSPAMIQNLMWTPVNNRDRFQLKNKHKKGCGVVGVGEGEKLKKKCSRDKEKMYKGPSLSRFHLRTQIP